VLLATLITRTRKPALPKLVALHVLPHVSDALPSRRVDCAVVSVGVVLADVHDAPPSADSWTHMRGLPLVLSTRASSRTSIPLIDAPPGSVNP
jgi:hypothetical protein